MNEFDFTTMKPQVDLFSIVFWKKLKTPKRHFEINWPLVAKSNLLVRFLEETSAWKNHFDFVWPLLVSQQQKFAFTLSKLGTRQLVFWYDPTIAFTHAALDPSITKGIVCVMRTMNWAKQTRKWKSCVAFLWAKMPKYIY